MCHWTYRRWKTTRQKRHRNLLTNLQFNSPCSLWNHLCNLQFNSQFSPHRNLLLNLHLNSLHLNNPCSPRHNQHLNILCRLWHPHLSKSLYKLLPPLHPPLLKHPRAVAVA